MRAAVSFGHAKPLCGANGNIRAHLPRFFEQGQGQRISRNNPDALVLMQRSDVAGEIAHMAIGARILEDRAEDLCRVQIVRAAHDDLDPQRGRAGFQNRDVLGMTVFVHEEAGCLGLRDALRHRHRLGTCRCFVQQRGIGDFQTGQIGDHRLEIQQRLQATLRDLWLIWRVSRVPGRVFQDVALDGWWRHGAVVPLTDQAGHQGVFLCRLTHLEQQLTFRQRAAKVQRLFLADGGRQRVVDQRIQIIAANNVQHLGHLVRGWADVAAICEVVRQIVGWFERHGLLQSNFKNS